MGLGLGLGFALILILILILTLPLTLSGEGSKPSVCGSTVHAPSSHAKGVRDRSA